LKFFKASEEYDSHYEVYAHRDYSKVDEDLLFSQRIYGIKGFLTSSKLFGYNSEFYEKLENEIFNLNIE
jgi:hypothetical protein